MSLNDADYKRWIQKKRTFTVTMRNILNLCFLLFFKGIRGKKVYQKIRIAISNKQIERQKMQKREKRSILMTFPVDFFTHKSNHSKNS